MDISVMVKIVGPDKFVHGPFRFTKRPTGVQKTLPDFSANASLK